MTATSSTELPVPALGQAASTPAQPTEEFGGSGRTEPVFVPGYGWVEWPAALLDAQARYLSFIHRADRRTVRSRLRRLFGRRRVLPRLCVFCGAAWPCAEGAWAKRWLAQLSRWRWRRHGHGPSGSETQRHHGGQGRHRARSVRRLTAHGERRRPPRVSRGGRRRV